VDPEAVGAPVAPSRARFAPLKPAPAVKAKPQLTHSFSDEEEEDDDQVPIKPKVTNIYKLTNNCYLRTCNLHFLYIFSFYRYFLIGQVFFANNLSQIFRRILVKKTK
jgi:hypothetical protein